MAEISEHIKLKLISYSVSPNALMLESFSMKTKAWFLQLGQLALLLGLLVIGLTSSNLVPGDQSQLVRAYTRSLEFDYVGWTVDALRVKWKEFSLNTSSFLNLEDQRQIVLGHLKTIAKIQQLEDELNLIYADPHVSDPLSASQAVRESLEVLYAQRAVQAPLAEAILQNQISAIVDELGLAYGGQNIPPTLFHSTPLPTALIVSPRDVIRQDQDISLIPNLPIDQRFQLEAQVDRALNVSSLVVDIGGVGVYPTMVQETSNLDWLSEVVAHEWIHNFLTLRPLGMNYLTSPELRVMNETTASLAGKEIGQALLERYYPELAPPREETQNPEELEQEGAEGQDEEMGFNYRKEMNKTRVRADELLAQGKIEEAEAYMEERRVIFWENGYRHLRKLNQAYFAFHGAYADEPGGAAGAVEDPIGDAVRTLRARSASLADFLDKISWMTTYEQLKEAVTALEGSPHAGN